MSENMRNSVSEPLVRVTEVARRLNISRSLAYRLVQQGDLPCIRINHSVRVRASDLDEYVAKHWSGWTKAPELDT